MNIAFSEFNNSSITTSMCRGTDQSEVNPEESSNSKLYENIFLLNLKINFDSPFTIKELSN